MEIPYFAENLGKFQFANINKEQQRQYETFLNNHHY